MDWLGPFQYMYLNQNCHFAVKSVFIVFYIMTADDHKGEKEPVKEEVILFSAMSR